MLFSRQLIAIWKRLVIYYFEKFVSQNFEWYINIPILLKSLIVNCKIDIKKRNYRIKVLFKRDKVYIINMHRNFTTSDHFNLKH